MVMNMEKHKPYISMILIQLIYTGMSLFSKAAISEGMKSSIFVAYRQGIATLALAPFALFLERNKSTPLSFRLLSKIFFVSLCGATLSLNLFYFGMRFVSATFATAMTNTIPAMVFFMAVFLRMESLSLNKWHGIAKVLGSVIGLSGAMVFTFFKGPALFEVGGDDGGSNAARHYSTADWIKGSALMLGSNLTWALWLIMQRPILKEYPSKLRLTTLQCCFSCTMSTIWGAATERDIESWKLGWNINLLSVAYCGVVVTGVSYWLQVWVVEKKGPVFTAIFSPLALILTAIFSAIIFKDTIYVGSVLGAVLLVGGLYSFLWGKKNEVKIENQQNSHDGSQEVTLECIICTSMPENKKIEEKEGEQTKTKFTKQKSIKQIMPLECIVSTGTTKEPNEIEMDDFFFGSERRRSGTGIHRYNSPRRDEKIVDRSFTIYIYIYIFFLFYNFFTLIYFCTFCLIHCFS